MSSEGTAADDPEASVSTRRAARRARGRLVALALLSGLVVLLPTLAAGQTRRAPRPSPTPDPALEQLDKVLTEFGEMRKEIAAVREDVAAVSAHLDTIDGTASAVKGIVEPMREEVRGLYVETSNLRGDITRLEETYTANTDSLAKSRYVLTLLLVATALLQLIVLAVLLRSR